MRGLADIHCLFGWLQIGRVLPIPANVIEVIAEYRWLADHPHLEPEYAMEFAVKKNTVFIATETMSLNAQSMDLPGGGVFRRWTPSLQVTAEGHPRSRWRLPGWMLPRDGRRPLSCHDVRDRRKPQGDSVLLHTVPIGQEFVLDTAMYPEALPWLKGLFMEHALPLG